MFGRLFASVGGLLGNALGGGILSTVGRFAGRMLGNYIEQAMHEPDES